MKHAKFRKTPAMSSFLVGSICGVQGPSPEMPAPIDPINVLLHLVKPSSVIRASALRTHSLLGILPIPNIQMSGIRTFNMQPLPHNQHEDHEAWISYNLPAQPNAESKKIRATETALEEQVFAHGQVPEKLLILEEEGAVLPYFLALGS